MRTWIVWGVWALKVVCVGAGYLALLAAPFVFFKTLNTDDPRTAREVVGYAKILGADLTLLRVQDLIGSVATMVPFYIALFQKNAPRVLYGFMVCGLVGYGAYLKAQFMFEETAMKVVVQTIFGDEAQEAAALVRTSIELTKLFFFWMVVAAVAVKFKWTDSLLKRIQS